jgi:hypothetical protein
VAGFALAGDPADPVVCVRVEVGDQFGVWIGRPWPGRMTYVIAEPIWLQRVSLEDAQAVLEGWPATRGNAGDAIQAAAWHGRRELTRARMQAVTVPHGPAGRAESEPVR